MYEDRLKQYFDKEKENLVEDIIKWVSIQSDRGVPEPEYPYGKGPAQALKTALNRAGEMGFLIKNYENYVGTVSFMDDSSHLDILAHLDVVPANSEDWKEALPYDPAVKDGKIYGRGVIDDKGPAVCALYAMKAVRDLGIPLKKNVRLILGTDEECGCSDIRYFYEREKEAPMTFSPDGDFPVVNTEKGRLHSGFFASFPESSLLPRIVKIYAGQKINVVPDKAEAVLEGFTKDSLSAFISTAETLTGVSFCVVPEEPEMLKITASGRAGHAASPQEANNAITALLYLLSILPMAKSEGFSRIKSLAEIFPHGDWLGEAAGIRLSDDISGSLTISLNMIQADVRSVSCEFDSRCPLAANDDNVRKVLLQKGKKEGLDMQNSKMEPPHHVPEDTPFINTLLSVYEKNTGKKGFCFASGGGTYVHDLKNGVAFGCIFDKKDHNMHGPDEFCIISEMITSAKIFAEVIIRLCG